MKLYEIWFFNSGLCLIATIIFTSIDKSLNLGWLNSTIQIFLAALVIKGLEK